MAATTPTAGDNQDDLGRRSCGSASSRRSNMPGPLAARSACAPPRSTAVSSFSPTLTGRDTCLPFEYTASTM